MHQDQTDLAGPEVMHLHDSMVELEIVESALQRPDKLPEGVRDQLKARRRKLQQDVAALAGG